MQPVSWNTEWFSLNFYMLYFHNKSGKSFDMYRNWFLFICSTEIPHEKLCFVTFFPMLYSFSADRFIGKVEMSNVTKAGGMVTWSKAGIDIEKYIVKIKVGQNESITQVNETSYQFEGLDPGTFYQLQVIPVKCNRTLNPQNISFFTCKYFCICFLMHHSLHFLFHHMLQAASLTRICLKFLLNAFAFHTSLVLCKNIMHRFSSKSFS